MSEELQFLKDLQKEMNEQENDGQAAPRFWTIMDYKWEPTDSDYAERISLFDTDDPGTITIEDYVGSVLDGEYEGDFTEEEIEELRERKELEDENELVEWFEEYDRTKRYFIVYEKEESHIAWNTLFFTKQEAKDHLKANAHHYTDKAHTFAMTAWRAPKMERLMNILENFDWDSVKG